MKRKQLVLLAVCSIAFSGNSSVYASELTDGTDFETAEVVLAETEADILECGEEMAASESAEGQKEEQHTQQEEDSVVSQDDSTEQEAENLTGWVTLENGRKCYYGTDGVQKEGWCYVDGKKYYFDPGSGYMHKGWLRLSNGKQYYFEQDGTLTLGWRSISGKKYYFDAKYGYMHVGWVTMENGSKYYMNADGTRFTGIRSLGGKKYYFQETNGKLLTSRNNYEIKGKIYNIDASGVMTQITAPAAATMKSAECVSYNQIKVSWSASSGASGYYVYMYVDGTWKKVGETTQTNYTITGTTETPINVGQKYKFVVKAFKKCGNKILESGYCKKSISGSTVADAPQLISAELTAKDAITIRWNKAGGAAQYKIYRVKTDGSWEEIATVDGADKVGYTHKSSTAHPIVLGQTYTYVVRSYTGSVMGKYQDGGIVVQAVMSTKAYQAELDAEVQKLLASVTNSSMSRSQKLRACWYKIMSYSFLPWKYPDTTQENWKIQCATDYLKDKGGNCYGMAHSFAACAKALGYTPYVICIPKVHCFVQIDGLYWDNMGNKMGVSSAPMSYTASQKYLF